MERTDTSILDSPAPEAQAPVRLLIEESGHPPRVYALAVGTECRIGRDQELEVVLSDVRVSRCHAAMHFDGQGITVRDLGSSNGTYVGDIALTSPVRIVPGQMVRVGNTRIVAVLPGGPTMGARPQTHGPIVGPIASGSDVVAVDAASVALFSLVRRLAASDLPVLLQGETGSGKEVVARALHRYSQRAGGPFVGLNCATLTESLAESELFGHERGSFTGAIARRTGAFEAAHCGTLLLDEVGELSPTSQARLLRALQERVVLRVGATRPTPVDVRIVAATNRDLLVDVAHGRFREDLYFRLNGVTVEVPPLRARPRDVLPLVERIFMDHGGAWSLGPGVSVVLQGYRWPGNVRELRNAIECAMTLADGDQLRLEHLPPAVRGENASGTDAAASSVLRERVDDLERRTIVAALDHTRGNQSQAAREIGISRRALIYKMERYGLKLRPGSERDG